MTYLLVAKTILFNKVGIYNSIINPNTMHFGGMFTNSMELNGLEFLDMMKYKFRITHTFQNNRTR